MINYSTLTSIFSNIADAIRIRNGTSAVYTPDQMPDAIMNIATTDEGYTININGNVRLGKPEVNSKQETYGPITIGSNVTDCSFVFQDCVNLNQPITIPNGVTSCWYMFRNCTNFNQPITVPTSVNSVVAMFDNCVNMNSTVYLPNKFNTGTTTAFWPNCPVSVENGTLIFY